MPYEKFLQTKVIVSQFCLNRGNRLRDSDENYLTDKNRILDKTICFYLAEIGMDDPASCQWFKSMLTIFFFFCKILV